MSPWICSKRIDSVFIIAPAFVISFLVILFPSVFASGAPVPLWAWIVFILLIDVAHVYGTLFRTYLDPSARERFSTVLWVIPLACWLGGVALYSVSAGAFWRTLAYVAVFHFIRQQYGFMRLYSRQENSTSTASRRIDQAAIYMAALYPMIYWHTHLPRQFNWFLDGEFLDLRALFGADGANAVDGMARAVYVAVFIAYAVKEWRSRANLNWPKNLLLLGTAVSWMLGIVIYNGDMAFTAINVVAHGLPYMALTWNYRQHKTTRPHSLVPAIAVFLAVIFAFAYAEETLWDAMVWSDHPEIFGWAAFLPNLKDSAALVWIVPLLSLPQSAHYILDGFIWKISDTKSKWLFAKRAVV